MSRRRRAEKREVLPDAKFGEILVTKFMNCLMNQGKKSVAEGIVYGAFDIIRVKAKKDPLEIFKDALRKVGPDLEVRSRRVGGATYQVPTDVRPDRRMALAMRWLIIAMRKRAEKTSPERLAAELMAAANDNGAAIKKREDTLKMAEANKAFAHYRW
jgi:small subunit ribosomal protein S7